MTKPRCIRPNVIHFLTRRCSERRYFLRPDPEVKQIFEYLLGLLAKAHGIQVHAYLVMSDHYHLVVTDSECRLPDFQRNFNALLARSINELRNRSESIWDRRSYNAVELLDDAAVLDKMAYTLVNPVEDRLVNHAHQWKGATSIELAFGEVRQVTKPSVFFGDSMPETVELELTRPRCFQQLNDVELLIQLRTEVTRREKEYGKLGQPMGMARVRAISWRSSPKSEEPRGQLRPTVASRDRPTRLEALRRAKEWLNAYKNALAQFVAGIRNVEFPSGTWWMCVRLRCRVALE